ncbi:MAG TPA: hypothetical protein ENJ52_01430 [Aliiroseovarius sp.]|nr:hypothetical protein [Aliiroseovarius sp.]
MILNNIAVLAAVLLSLAGCQPEERLPGDPSAAQMRQDRAECEARGGEYARAGLFGHACFMPTPDAGQACSRAGDCEGVCYADTRQCSAVTPVFGCIAMLDEDGKRVEICID